MRNHQSVILRRFITSAVLAGATLGSSSAFASCEPGRVCDPTLPVVVVPGNSGPAPYVPPPPVYVPPEGGGGDGGYGGGEGGNGDGSGPDPAPAVCVELTMHGLPDGCDRTLANAGTPVPNFSQPWQIDHLLAGPYGSVFSGLEGDARGRLAECYANVSVPPTECDEYYRVTLWGFSQYLPSPSQELIRLSAAIEALAHRAQVAQGNRELNSWLSPGSHQFSFYGIGINLGFISNFLLLDQYNQALIAARQQRLCKLWYAAWDGNACDAY